MSSISLFLSAFRTKLGGYGYAGFASGADLHYYPWAQGGSAETAVVIGD